MTLGGSRWSAELCAVDSSSVSEEAEAGDAAADEDHDGEGEVAGGHDEGDAAVLPDGFGASLAFGSRLAVPVAVAVPPFADLSVRREEVPVDGRDGPGHAEAQEDVHGVRT